MNRGNRGSVLVIDDDRSFRELLRTVLETRGFDVLVAGDGVQALAVAERRPLDAVITDFDMPRMNGLELCRALRKHAGPRERAVPVWIVTGAPDLSRKEALAAGATEMIRKPCHVLEISMSIERHLQAAPPLPGETQADLSGFLPGRPRAADNAGSPEPAALPLR